jgi:hypothetical protein
MRDSYFVAAVGGNKKLPNAVPFSNVSPNATASPDFDLN